MRWRFIRVFAIKSLPLFFQLSFTISSKFQMFLKYSKFLYRWFSLLIFSFDESPKFFDGAGYWDSWSVFYFFDEIDFFYFWFFFINFSAVDLCWFFLFFCGLWNTNFFIGLVAQLLVFNPLIIWFAHFELLTSISDWQVGILF